MGVSEREPNHDRLQGNKKLASWMLLLCGGSAHPFLQQQGKDVKLPDGTPANCDKKKLPTADHDRGKDYNHSTFIDLIIEGKWHSLD